MYLVDTNIVSQARRGTPQAASWFRSVDPLSIHLSALTLGEIMRGIALKQKTDPKAAAHLTEWLRKLRHDHGDRILPVTDQIAVEWGRIAAIRPRGDIDGLQGKDVGEDRLNDREVARLVKNAAPAAGVRGDLTEAERAEKFSGHSLRAGLATVFSDRVALSKINLTERPPIRNSNGFVTRPVKRICGRLQTPCILLPLRGVCSTTDTDEDIQDARWR
jgi:predicted nucleic acid-binding protein